jgi:hypothetical protein
MLYFYFKKGSHIADENQICFAANSKKVAITTLKPTPEVLILKKEKQIECKNRT